MEATLNFFLNKKNDDNFSQKKKLTNTLGLG
jgi:hypothetical protein